MKYSMYNTAQESAVAFDHCSCFWPSCGGSTTMAFLATAYDGPSSLLTKRTNMRSLSVPFTSFITVPPTALSISHQPPALGAGFTH
jgi:hypothetical protein